MIGTTDGATTSAAGRVYEIARRLGVSAWDVLDVCRAFGFANARRHTSALDASQAAFLARFRDEGGFAPSILHAARIRDDDARPGPAPRARPSVAPPSVAPPR